jgi:crotonobetainyl-CoA hydratase
MADYEFCKVEREGRLTVVTLNRPEVMNALHAPAHAELGQVFDDFAADPEQWVAIVTGAGERAFSAGNDLKVTAAGGGSTGSILPRHSSGFGGLVSRFDLDKPLIAAVNGIAMGGGFEIALACDLILAADTAVFALPEPRVGLAALAGGLHRLPREIGTKRALGMILTARRVGAAEGKELGFVNEVVPAAQLMERARSLAKQIMELSPMSVRASKQAVYRGLNEASIDAALKNQNTYPAVAAMYKSDDLREGPKAFAEKRAPQWKGK